MSGGFSDLVKIYIENLNLPKETKQKLLASSPKTLADVSLWLDKNREVTDVQEGPKTNQNPFSSKIKSDIAKEIQLFTNSNQKNPVVSSFMFNDGGLVDTDDASWGLGLDKTQSAADVQLYSCSTNKNQSRSQTVNYPQDTEKEQAIKESQDNAIASIRESVNSAIETVMAQTEEQGIVSKAYNSVKEYFDSEMSMSSVCRVIYAEKATADLLQRAQDGSLTKEEYWKAKISTAIDMLTAGRELSDEERTCLEERFAQYSPEELNALIDRIKYTSNEDYPKLTAQVDKLIKEGRNLLQSRQSDSSSAALNDVPNSIRALMKNAQGKELMTFDEVWEAERGVEFSPEAVKEYDEAAAKYAMAVTVSNRADKIHSSVSKAMNRLKATCQPEFTYEQRLEAEMQTEMILLSQLRMLYGDDEEKINEELQKISDGKMSYKNGRIECGAVQKTKYLLNASQKFLDEIEERKNKMLGCRTVEGYRNEMASAYEHAYGRKNATQLARAFESDQEEVVGKVRTGVEYAGLGVMVAGMFIYPPAAFAGAMMSSFGGTGVEALNESTRKDGLTKEAKEKIQKELLTNAALFVVGGAAGKMGSAAKTALIAEKCPALMACIADIGIDSTISLIGDMALTGQIDLEGEGLSQLMSLLAGHVRAGKFGKNKVSRQDMNPAKNPAFNHALEDLRRTDPKLYEDYKLLRSKNMLPSNFGSAIINASDSKLNANLKKEIAMLADCARKGINPIDAFVPKMKSLAEASSTKKTGEVFSLEGTNDVYIMDDSGPVKLDMDRDMYFALFPPVQSYCTNQGSMGDCYFVSTILDGAMNNPKAKVALMKMFRQQGNDIVIDIGGITNIETGTYRPNDAYDNCPSQIVFKNAKKRMSLTANAGASTAQGLKLLEEAYGYKLAAAEIANCMNDTNIPQDKQKRIFEELQKVFEDDSYKPSKEFLEIMEKTFKAERDNFYIKNYNADSNVLKSLKAKILVKAGGIDAVRQKAIGNGGYLPETLKNFFGLSDDATDAFYTLSSEDAFIMYLREHQNNPNMIFSASTADGNAILDQLAVLFGAGTRGRHTIAAPHAYRIDSFDLEKKTISIVNPWDTTKIITLSFDEFRKYFCGMYATDVSKTVENTTSKPLLDTMQKLGIDKKSPNGRNYTNEELVDKYLEKLQKEKNLYPPYFRNLSKNDHPNQDALKNKSLVELHNKLVDKYGNRYGESVVRAVCQLGDGIYDSKRIDTLVKNLDRLLENPDIDFETAFSLATTIHSDYEFVIEKSAEIIGKLKAKGYNDEVILKIMRSIDKENFEEMKKLWE